MRKCIYACMHVYMHLCMGMYMHTCTYMCMYMYRYMYMYMHACILMYACMYTDVCTYRYTNTTCTCQRLRLSVSRELCIYVKIKLCIYTYRQKSYVMLRPLLLYRLHVAEAFLQAPCLCLSACRRYVVFSECCRLVLACFVFDMFLLYDVSVFASLLCWWPPEHFTFNKGPR